MQPDYPKFRAPGIWEGIVSEDGGLWRRTNFLLNFISIGVRMEDNVEMIKAVNREAEESKNILQKLCNEVIAIDDVIQPALIEKLQEMRSNRMAMVAEVNSIMNSLKEIRKFFFESDYELEMERLERFLAVCRELKEMKQSGMLDAIADIAIRLALKEESNERK